MVMLSTWMEEQFALTQRLQIVFFNAFLAFVLSLTLITLPIYAADRCETPGFQLGESLLTGTGPVAIAMGDFNRDGKPDLVAANSGSDSVSVFLAAGRGKFSNASNFTVGKSPRAVAVGDLNGDGRLDLAVANSQSDDISLLLGDGHGRFDLAGTLKVGKAPVALAIADFNQDRNLDLATANSKSNSVR